MTGRRDAAQARWQHGFDQLRAHTAAHGTATVHLHTVTDGFTIGRWAARQRERYWARRLAPHQVEALQALPGWDWGHTDRDRWAQGFAHLQDYVHEHGHPTMDTTTIHHGYELGAWVARRRGNYHRGTLKPERAAALAALPGWRWTLTEDRWPDGLAALRTYVHRHGTARIPHDTVVDGFPLGHWVAARRAQRKRNALTPAQVRTLAALPGWVWEIRQTRWEQGLRLLTAYADRTGAPNPNSFYVEATEDNFTLGAWAMSRRKEYRRGVLAADRIQALEAIPGWEWAPYDAAWQRHYQLLRQVGVEQGSVAYLSQRTVVHGVPIGHWVMTQRSRHRTGRLRQDRRAALQSLPGWNWAPPPHHAIAPPPEMATISPSPPAKRWRSESRTRR